MLRFSRKCILFVKGSCANYRAELVVLFKKTGIRCFNGIKVSV
jgi:hypothetical protein